MSFTKPTASSRKNLHTSRTTADDDDDPTSSSGSSSSDSEDEANDSEDDDEIMRDDRTTATATASTAAQASSSLIPNIPGRPKPRIHRMQGGSELLSKLSAFLPKMKDANEDLEKEIAAGRGKEMVLDDVDDQDGKDYIEMNLGLGVLEERREGSESSDSEDEADSKSISSSGKESAKKGDSDVLDKLMGGKQSAAADKPSIEEMGE